MVNFFFGLPSIEKFRKLLKENIGEFFFLVFKKMFWSINWKIKYKFLSKIQGEIVWKKKKEKKKMFSDPSLEKLRKVLRKIKARFFFFWSSKKMILIHQ